jgi:hypothetical protein
VITSKQLLEELERYEKDVEAILSRFSPKYDVNPDDAPKAEVDCKRTYRSAERRAWSSKQVFSPNWKRLQHRPGKFL